jgi:hypothetical protein
VIRTYVGSMDISALSPALKFTGISVSGSPPAVSDVEPSQPEFAPFAAHFCDTLPYQAAIDGITC